MILIAVLLGKLLDFSELQFSQLRNGTAGRSTVLRRKRESNNNDDDSDDGDDATAFLIVVRIK